MSIINAMLNDLDTRLAREESTRKEALQGLFTADGDLGCRSRSPYRLVALIGLVILLGLLVMTGGSRVASKTIDSVPSTSPMISLDEISGSAVLETAIQLPGRVEGGEPGSFAKVDDPVLAAGAHEGAHLKLALWMGGDGIPANSENLVEASIDALPVTSTLDLILASADQGRVSIELTLNGNPGYLLYTLQNPPRAVVELENTLLAAELPALGDVRALLAGVRARQLSNGSLRVIFDLHQSSDIYSTDVVSEDGLKKLVVDLTPAPVKGEREEPAEDTRLALPVETPLSVASTATTPLESSELASDPVFSKVPSQSSADYYREAVAFSESGRLGRAEQALSSALVANPEHADARMLLVSNLVQQGRTRDALMVLQEGLAISPTEPKLASLYARLLVRLGRVDRALATLKRAAPQLSSDPAYHAFIAALNQRLGEHRVAASTYQDVLEYVPENGVWWMGMAISLEALDEQREAVKAYQRALQAQSLTQDLERYVGQRLLVLKQPRNS